MRGRPDGEDRDAAERVGGRRRLRLFGAMFILVALVLHFGTPLGVLDAFFLAALLVLLPSMAVAQLGMIAGARLERKEVYLSSGLTILLLGAASFLIGARRIGLEGMGLGPIAAGELLAWTLGLTAAGFALIGVFHLAARRLGIEETSILEQLLPETRSEKALFAGLSLAAGLGEELAYRAYAMSAIALALSPVWGAEAGMTMDAGGLWLAAVLSSIAFGFLHAYQGLLGVVRTALLGMVLAVSFLISESLWPAIAAHALIDLIAGLIVGRRLLPPGN